MIMHKLHMNLHENFLIKENYSASFRPVIPNFFWHHGLVSRKNVFSTDRGWGWGRFQDDSSTLHLLSTLFLLLLNQVHFRPLGTRSRKLRTPALVVF